GEDGGHPEGPIRQRQVEVDLHSGTVEACCAQLEMGHGGLSRREDLPMKRMKTAMLLIGATLCVTTSLTPAYASLFGCVPNGGNSDLVQIDPGTGVATEVGPVGISQVNGLAGKQSSVILYGSVGLSGSDTGKILTINPFTGAGTVIGQDPFVRPITALAF